MKICMVKDCTRPYRAKGFCHSHYWTHNYHPLFVLWQNILQRCNNPNATGYKNYGGRGIRVCERWHIFDNFVADVGERPPGTTLDRIDNDGNYEPGNCRWATRSEQSLNTRLNRRNKTGVKGVSWDTKRNKWRASIKINGVETSARFTTIEEAIAAREQWAKTLETVLLS